MPGPMPTAQPALTAPGPAAAEQRSQHHSYERVWRPGRPVAVHTTLGPQRRGGGDPTYRVTADGAVWRCHRTPLGPVTLRIAGRPGWGEVVATAWGSGAPWALEHLPAALGEGDDLSGFLPRHPMLRDLAARHPGWRVPCSGLVLEALVPAVLEQKVTGTEARRSWRYLVQRFGEPAPGPAPAWMRVPPDARTWTLVPSWEWHRAGVDGRRSRTAVMAAGRAGRLEECTDLPRGEAAGRLTSLPGVGVWTAAEVAQRALGDADAVSYGDVHMAKDVTFALVGEALGDDELREILRPWAGHRYRVVRLCELSGVRAPRRAPRLAPRDFRAM